MTALKWSYVYGSLHVERYDTLDEAVRAAKGASDEGTESLHCIEVWDDDGHRVIDKEGVWKLTKPLDDAEDAYWQAQPTPTTVVWVSDPDGKEARYGNYAEAARAVAVAADLAAVVGTDRVRVSPFPR